MSELTIKCVDAFTTKPFCGNPAGVILESEGLSSDVMQRIASDMKLNLIELAFVCRSQDPRAPYRIRFFTPTSELDISGHVTVATTYALIEEGMLPIASDVTMVNFETRTGNVPVEIHSSAEVEGDPHARLGESTALSGTHGPARRLERIMIHEPIYRFRQTEVPVSELASVLDIDENEIVHSGLPVMTASYELDWLIIPVKHRKTILGMKPDLIKLGLLNRKYGILTNHIFTLDAFDADCIAYSRHFGPAMGLWEDPASANAAAGLGVYLLEHGVSNSSSMVMQQGKESGNLARIYVEVERNEGIPTAVKVGGLAVTSITRRINIESGEIVTL